MLKRSEIEFFLKYATAGIFVSILLAIFKISFLKISFFSLHYFWHLALLSPYVSRKYKEEKYRYSFLNYLTKFHDFVLSFDPFQKSMFSPQIARFLGPLFFTSALLIVNQNLGTLLYGILGSFLIEAYAALNLFYKQFSKSDSK